jgi:tRNA(Ile)-lysidine synthase
MLNPAPRGEPDHAGSGRIRANTPMNAETGFSPNSVAELFLAWRRARGVVLAVSGGPDSVALMLLAAEWSRAGEAPPLSVATVDHGLRGESRFEAEQVAQWATALALPHEILAWSGPRPKSRIQELAREARYELLFKHAVEVGADIVATAHHADDQAETILFRLLRGSGVAGLAGMAEASPRDGLVLSRPLLGCAKAELAALCEARAHPYFSDPSNQNPAYARTRMRALASFLAEYGLDRDALLRLGRRAARAEAALAERAEAARANWAAARDQNHFSADFTFLANQSDEIVQRIITQEIKSLSGDAFALRLARLETLTLALLRAFRRGESFAATLGGCKVSLRRSGALIIALESGRKRGFAAAAHTPANGC